MFKNAFDLLWKYWIILGVSTAVFATAAVVYWIVTPKIYKTEILVAYQNWITDDESGSFGGALPSFAKALSLGGDQGGGKQIALAKLESSDLARLFIAQHKIGPILLENVDELPSDPGKVRWMELKAWRDAFGVFEDKTNGLIKISVEWPNNEIATEWVKQYLILANETMRVEFLKKTQDRISYLETTLAQQRLSEVRGSVARLLEKEHYNLMLANMELEFSFQTINAAMLPPVGEYAYPRLGITLFFGLFFGLLSGLVLVVILEARTTPGSVATDPKG